MLLAPRTWRFNSAPVACSSFGEPCRAPSSKPAAGSALNYLVIAYFAMHLRECHMQGTLSQQLKELDAIGARLVHLDTCSPNMQGNML